MATPAWVRARRRVEHATTALIRADQREQALTRVKVQHEREEPWTPRRGMGFASETP